jgi:hypothetical protein
VTLAMFLGQILRADGSCQNAVKIPVGTAGHGNDCPCRWSASWRGRPGSS